eukprot:TRINITY_DN20158_c0_g1_i4.p1 TRINITY_DN20158_c0_g1~~TRINITY_DN20158_c0_g1_i4.p1  ORF type:complete len:326 (-),score=85.88 TRINITY_DN20158_c0_g1_i4:235-1188(-)
MAMLDRDPLLWQQDRQQVMEDLKVRMRQAAEQLDFTLAQQLKSQLEALQATVPASSMPNPRVLQADEVEARLAAADQTTSQRLLQLHRAIQQLEQQRLQQDSAVARLQQENAALQNLTQQLEQKRLQQDSAVARLQQENVALHNLTQQLEQKRLQHEATVAHQMRQQQEQFNAALQQQMAQNYFRQDSCVTEKMRQQQEQFNAALQALTQQMEDRFDDFEQALNDLQPWDGQSDCSGTDQGLHNGGGGGGGGVVSCPRCGGVGHRARKCPLCDNCGQYGHIWKCCGMPIRCSNCGRNGHTQRVCRNPRPMTFPFVQL